MQSTIEVGYDRLTRMWTCHIEDSRNSIYCEMPGSKSEKSEFVLDRPHIKGYLNLLDNRSKVSAKMSIKKTLAEDCLKSVISKGKISALHIKCKL